MVRTRRAPRELTESWDDIAEDDEQGSDSLTYDEEDERREVGSEYRSRFLRDGDDVRSSAYHDENETPRRRNLRPSAESTGPDLVMPASPDGGADSSRAAQLRAEKKRAQTPHFRMNERSLTSDAGFMHKIPERQNAPRFRMSDRSMTSDAGRMRGSSRLKEEVEQEGRQNGNAAAQGLSILWQQVLQPLLSYAGSVAGLAIQNAKPLLGWALLIYAVAAALIFASGFITNSLTNALSPICRLPLTSHLSFCPQINTPEIQGGAAEFDKLVQAQDAFQDVIASSQTGINLPLDMKRSEAGIRDLKHIVQYSKLDSRNELVFEFTGFIDTARQASADLSRFNSRIGRALDHILATNRWTLGVIGSVAATTAAQGTLTRWVSNNLNIFSPFQPLELSRDLLLEQYLRHTSAVEEQILQLIDEAHALRAILDNLDNRLDVIASIAARDGVKAAGDKDELFASLWTKLGGNRSSVAKLQGQLALLQSVGQYRRAAWGHVTTTLLKLQEIQHSLEDLRERVAMPETLGTERVPLEVHIQSINLGIERLEYQRDATRRLEAENYARVVGKSEGAERKMLEARDA